MTLFGELLEEVEIYLGDCRHRRVRPTSEAAAKWVEGWADRFGYGADHRREVMRVRGMISARLDANYHRFPPEWPQDSTKK